MKGKNRKILIVLTLIMILTITSSILLENKIDSKQKSEESSQNTDDRKTKNNWKEFKLGDIKFQALENLKEKYIYLIKWPPEIEIITNKNNWPLEIKIEDGELKCENNPKESSLPKKVYKQNINGRTYCIKAKSEGAGGATYRDYTYLTVHKRTLISINFILKFSNCSNYPEPQRLECKEERENFSMGSVINKIVNSISFVSSNSYLEKAITDFLLTQKRFSWKTDTNSKNFCVIDNLGKDNSFPVYVWARCGEFIKEDQELKEKSGCSLPVKINYPSKLSYFHIDEFSYEVPEEGSQYSESIREIFPESIQEIIFNYHKKRIEEITKKLKSTAVSWFELK